jgi:hypothetical protein
MTPASWPGSAHESADTDAICAKIGAGGKLQRRFSTWEASPLLRSISDFKVLRIRDSSAAPQNDIATHPHAMRMKTFAFFASSAVQVFSSLLPHSRAAVFPINSFVFQKAFETP